MNDHAKRVTEINERLRVLAVSRMLRTKNIAKGGWDGCTYNFLLKKAREELDEIEQHVTHQEWDEVRGECGDAAAFLAMMADNSIRSENRRDVLPVIYLAGPIADCTDEEARGWREETKEYLAGLAEFEDPMARDYRGAETGISAERIVNDDLGAIRKSNILLANLWKPGTGTPMEILWAKTKEMPVFVADPHLSPWSIFWSDTCVQDLATLLPLLKEYLVSRWS